MITIILLIILSLPLTIIILHTIIRLIRFFYKFPMPQFLANFIDNPLRRKIQPPKETGLRQGIKSGMNVLEVGPGNGRYTVEAAKIVGPNGRITTIDIENKMIERVIKRMETENITNINAEVANVYKLPYQDCSFDLIYMIAVFNEIPEQEKALTEFHRVLKPNGLLVFSELFMDPDYPLSKTLTKKVQSFPFKLKEKIGNFFYYTLKFEKI